MDVGGTSSISAYPMDKEELSTSPVSVMQSLVSYLPNTPTFALVPPQRSTQQSMQSSPTSTSPLHLLTPVAAEVLQRTENQSAWDVESYVRALGNKKYAAVKETRREALLQRAKQELGSSALNEATIRKQTNLASAEASRAKKEFILEQLYTQLKKKNEDAITLAEELRRLLSIVHQMNANHQDVYFQHSQNHQRRNHSAYVNPISEANQSTTVDHDTNIFHDNGKINNSTIPSQSHGDLDKSMYDAIMNSDGAQYQSNYGVDENTTVSATAFEAANYQQNMINFHGDANNMKMDEIVFQGAFDHEMIDEKAFDQNGLSYQQRMAQFSNNNPSDHYAMAG